MVRMNVISNALPPYAGDIKLFPKRTMPVSVIFFIMPRKFFKMY